MQMIGIFNMTHYNIYLGRNTKDGIHISAEDMDIFITNIVLPKFPEFSVSEITGYWGGKKEITTVISIITNMYSAPMKIEEISKEYKLQADQYAVLIESFEVSTKFI